MTRSIDRTVYLILLHQRKSRKYNSEKYFHNMKTIEEGCTKLMVSKFLPVEHPTRGMEIAKIGLWIIAMRKRKGRRVPKKRNAYASR